MQIELVVLYLIQLFLNLEHVKIQNKRIRKEAIIPTVEHDSNWSPSSRQCPTDCQRHSIREQEKSSKFGY